MVLNKLIKKLGNEASWEIFMTQLLYSKFKYVIMYPFTLLDWNMAKFTWFTKKDKI